MVELTVTLMVVEGMEMLGEMLVVEVMGLEQEQNFHCNLSRQVDPWTF